MLYFLMIVIGLISVAMMLFLAVTEKTLRYEYYRRQLHSSLMFIQPDGKRWEHALHRAHYVIGRDSRKCDLAPEALRSDGNVSRVHALFWYDGEHFRIAPVCRWNFHDGFYYTEVAVNGKTISPQGVDVGYSDEIMIHGHPFYLMPGEER